MACARRSESGWLMSSVPRAVRVAPDLEAAMAPARGEAVEHGAALGSQLRAVRREEHVALECPGAPVSRGRGRVGAAGAPRGSGRRAAAASGRPARRAARTRPGPTEEEPERDGADQLRPVVRRPLLGRAAVDELAWRRSSLPAGGEPVLEFLEAGPVVAHAVARLLRPGAGVRDAEVGPPF